MGYIEDYIKKKAMIKEFSEAVSYVKSNIDYPFDKISGYPEYADTKEHSGYVYVEKYTLHGDTYCAVRGRPDLFLKREGDNDEDNFHCFVDKKTVFKYCHFGYFLFPLKDGRYWMVHYEYLDAGEAKV